MSHPSDQTVPALSQPLTDEAATLDLGAALAASIVPKAVVHLFGDLGAGKTTLVRGLLRGLGFRGNVKSPTYTLVEVYAISNLKLHHFDFYRFSQPEEYLDAGLDEYFEGDGVCLVEWPDRADPYVPAPDLRIDLRIAGSGRAAHLEAFTRDGQTWLSALLGCLTPPESPPH
ncbi:MAG: tRNA (adenosine(37)-N6)-threonylcarbamoyltransferase complex ATPase subunit type 1 TsaE [Rhodocyclaceae bacterium]